MGSVLRGALLVVASFGAPPCLGDNAAFDEPVTGASGTTAATTSSDEASDTGGSAEGSSSGLGHTSMRLDGTSGDEPCAETRFSNFLIADLQALGTADVAIGVRASGTEWIADTTSGRIISVAQGVEVEVRAPGEGLEAGIGFELLQAQGLEGVIGLFSFGSVSVEFGSSLTGVGDKPLGILVAGDVTIDGTLSVASKLGVRVGAGGGLGGIANGGHGNGLGRGLAGEPNDSNHRPGGGGGGHGSPGGQGGYGVDESNAGGLGGLPYGNETLEPVTAGSGGAGAHGFSIGGAGGGGIHVAAGNAIFISGRVDASGAAATLSGSGNAGGGGGGSGGSVLLEAPRVEITGLIGANGGGGAAEFAGQDGSALSVPALGGDDGEGGAGSDLDGIAGNGISNSELSGTGGGGGAGRIRINFMQGNVAVDGLSPSAGSGLATLGPLQCLDAS